jgi:hypothetical protein
MHPPSSTRAALYYEIDHLPEEDQKAIHIVDNVKPPGHALVSGWRDRLGFAFRSTLSSLLLLRVTSTDKLMVEVAESSPYRLSILMQLPSIATEDFDLRVVDPIQRSQIRARQMASVAFEAIEKAVAQHGGTLIEHDGKGFEICLPLCSEETAP